MRMPGFARLTVWAASRLTRMLSPFGHRTIELRSVSFQASFVDRVHIEEGKRRLGTAQEHVHAHPAGCACAADRCAAELLAFAAVRYIVRRHVTAEGGIRNEDSV